MTPPTVSVFALMVTVRADPKVTAPVPRFRESVPMKVKSPFQFSALVLEIEMAATVESILPPVMVRVPALLPRAVLLLMSRVPADREMVPVILFAPERVVVRVELANVNPPVDEMMPAMLMVPLPERVRPKALVLTAPFTVSELVAVPLPTAQVWALASLIVMLDRMVRLCVARVRSMSVVLVVLPSVIVLIAPVPLMVMAPPGLRTFSPPMAKLAEAVCATFAKRTVLSNVPMSDALTEPGEPPAPPVASDQLVATDKSLVLFFLKIVVCACAVGARPSSIKPSPVERRTRESRPRFWLAKFMWC